MSVLLTQNLKQEYASLFSACTINPAKQKEVEAIIRKILSNKGRYVTVSNALGVPWFFIAVIHYMESSLDFSKHLHNGDPLSDRTRHVPAGRPKRGRPPFTWEQSAEDALKHQRVHAWSDWSIPGLLYKIESYSGWGYRLYHAHVKSPYLWGYSNHHTKGRYASDGTWSESAATRQCGAAVLLRRLVEKGMISLPEAIVTTPVTPTVVYSKSGKVAYAEELQKFLNQFPGIYLKVDGRPGNRTSQAFEKVFGHNLQGDPRGE